MPEKKEICPVQRALEKRAAYYAKKNSQPKKLTKQQHLHTALFLLMTIRERTYRPYSDTFIPSWVEKIENKYSGVRAILHERHGIYLTRNLHTEVRKEYIEADIYAVIERSSKTRYGADHHPNLYELQDIVFLWVRKKPFYSLLVKEWHTILASASDRSLRALLQLIINDGMAYCLLREINSTYLHSKRKQKTPS